MDGSIPRDVLVYASKRFESYLLRTERTSHTLITVDVDSLLNGNVNEYVEFPAPVESVFPPVGTISLEGRNSVAEREREGENEEGDDTAARAEEVNGGTSKIMSRVLSYLVSFD